MSNFQKGARNRSTHNQVVRLTVWVNDKVEEFRNRSVTPAEAVTAYFKDTGVATNQRLIKMVFESLDIPLFIRGKKGEHRTSPRVDRLITEAAILNDRIERIADEIGLDAALFGMTDGLKALVGRKGDPNAQSTEAVEQEG